MSLYNQESNGVWNFWCYFKTIKKNKTTGTEVVVNEGSFSPTYSGIYRIGEKVTTLDDTYEVVEYTVLALKPDISRVSNQDSTVSASLSLNLSSCVLNEDEYSATFTLKPWYNSSGLSWTSSSIISFSDIVDYFVPSNLTLATYTASTYEVEKEINSGNYNLLFEDIENSFDAFLFGYAIGFFIEGINGYANVYGPDYATAASRPFFSISQTLSGRAFNQITLDTEISGKSLVIGVCRDRNGVAITGSTCEVVVYGIDENNKIGSGTSSSVDGSFRIEADCKSYVPVLVTFINSSNNITGAEIMDTFGSSSSSSSSSRSSSSSSSNSPGS